MSATFSQFFPPNPIFTEKNLSDLSGKVFIVTGGASGVGLELSRILYGAGAKVYIAGRSETNAQKAIEDIKASSSDEGKTAGQVEFLHLQLDDLTTIKTTVETFRNKESELHVLWNNAGVSNPPAGSKSAQGYELQLATNVLGHLLFTQLLLPILRATAKKSQVASVRVVWAASVVVDLASPKGGLDMSDIKKTPSPDGQPGYANSKLGNWFLASEMAHQVADDGILSVVMNPGNLKTNLTRHIPITALLARPLLYPALKGAYTELYAGLSEDLTMKENGAYIVPWGRVHPAPRQDLLNALKSTDEENGTGLAREFWDWCEVQIKKYL
jgi:NAD(P)-dependent dehydrogenase (short-subunit alcohol dehydrogenase family)